MPRLTRWPGAALLVLTFTALAVAFTWPLARHLGDSVPSDLGDPLLNAWALGWDADRLKHGLRGFWDAPIFYPYRHTLAFSEHLLGIAIFVAPIVWATGNPLVAYNVAFIGSFVLAGIGMFVLARHLTGRTDAAWVAALVFAFTPARLGHLGHLQVLMSGWMPLALWALHRFVATTSTAHLAAFVAFVLLQSLSNNYFIYFLALPSAIVLAHGLWRAVPAARHRLAWGAAAAGATIGAVLLPIALVYVDVRQRFGLRRSVEDVTYFGADVAAYLHGNDAVTHPLTIWRHLPYVDKPMGSEGELFIGAFAIAAAAGAVVMAWWRWRAPDFRAARLYSVILAAAFVLSLGAQPAAWGVPLPIGSVYRALFNWFPGFDGLRVPARLSVVVALAVAVLAGTGVTSFVRSARRPIGWTVTALVTTIIWLESYAAPLPLAFAGRGGRNARAASTWIRDHAPGAMIELPTGEFAPTLQSYRYEYETLFHGRPIVNGASGYNSALHVFLGSVASPLLELSRAGDALTMLRCIGVATVVVHPHAYADPDLGRDTVAALRASAQVMEHVAVSDVEIFRLGQAQPRCADGAIDTQAVREIPAAAFTATATASPDRLPAAFDHDLDTRWLSGGRQDGREAIELAFDRPRAIARLQFLTNMRSIGNYPRRLVVESIAENGEAQTVFSGPVILPLALGLLRDPQRGPIDVWLQPNRSRRVRLLQTATTRRWFWAIDELSVWEAVP